VPTQNDAEIGAWQYGWQYHAFNALEKDELNKLLQALGYRSIRSNAAPAGKARLHSCMGRFAAAWLIVIPRSDALKLITFELNTAMRRRLGLAVTFDGLDTHGHAALTTNVGARFNARHSGWLSGWRQVLTEAGGQIPDRNVERLLRNTHIPIAQSDDRRLDLVVPGLNVAQGRPLFCDVTVVIPITGTGDPRGGTSNRGGSLLEACETENNSTYREVQTSGLGALYCLGAEVYGRWGEPCVKLLPELARERARRLHPRIRKSTALALQHRWAGVLAVGLQKAVSHIVVGSPGADLVRMQLEPSAYLAELDIM